MKALLALALAACALAQAPVVSDAEEQDLSRAVGEAGNSPLEFIRAVEKHLEKYPRTARRPDLERALVKAAIEAKDNRLVILYGERVLARETGDPQVLDRVTRALLASDARDTSERALKYAKRYVEMIAGMHASGAREQDEIDRALARALALQSRAAGNLGRLDEAVQLAARGYDVFPNAESAREMGRWLARSGRQEKAIARIADAFTIADPRIDETERQKDRLRMGELYRQLKGSEKGLGDIILEAYDRTTAQLAARRLRLRKSDPNAQVSKIMEFTLSGPGGDKLQLASLKGKTIVFDFWATWCGPCRAQHPLYEEVKRRFKNTPEVVFLSVNTDEERDGIDTFLKQNGWDKKVYFEDGLARMLRISSIPTTVIVDRRGEIFTRMNGYLPERFVDMLTERIRDALKN